MNEYNNTTLAILDYKIDELAYQKKEIEIRIAHLYELRQNLVQKMNEETRHVCCNQKEDVFR